MKTLIHNATFTTSFPLRSIPDKEIIDRDLSHYLETGPLSPLNNMYTNLTIPVQLGLEDE